MNTKCLKPTFENIKLCADLIKNDEIIAFPTETVYGLGASIFSVAAVEKIFKLKNRPFDNPLIAHIDSIESTSKIAEDIPDDFYKLAEKFFPGPLTIVLKARESVSKLVTANKTSIAIRMPKNEYALKLIKYAGVPIVAPSANISGRPSATSALHVKEDFDQKIPFILDGGICEIGIESTVIFLDDNPYMLRPGAVSVSEIEDTLNKKIYLPTKDHENCSPGVKYRHYAPSAPVYLKTTVEIKKMSLTRPLFLSVDFIKELKTEKLDRKNLYELFRFADRNNFNEVVIVDSSALRCDSALFNRIEKAVKRQ